jgi:methionine synthase I (cobalamin-dependent)
MVITHFCYTTSLRLNLIDLYAGSDVIYTNVFGQSIVILDKYETAVELLDKRSASYSNRYACVTPHTFRQG